MASSMTSTPYAAARATAAAGAPRAASKPFGVRYDAAKGLSAMLLAAMVSALVVVADQLIDTWADGHLLAAWVALWASGDRSTHRNPGENSQWATAPRYSATALRQSASHIHSGKSTDGDAPTWRESPLH